jgi:DNA-binding transcriptional MerR regulator/methylmalonyl-CoA mutase cobalamin-binding subunit
MLSPVYTVKRAAALTGISADTLRMWERRYGVVAPVRTEGGYRLYDDAAITRLTAMLALVDAGWAPREAAAQVASGTTLGPIAARPAETSRMDSGGDDPDGGAVDPELLVRLAMNLDTESLRHALDQVFADHDLVDLVDSWLMPALHRLGDAWQRGEVSVAAEHFVSAGVERRLATALDAIPAPENAPRILLGLGRGSRHELGLLAFAVLLRRGGLDATYLGCDLPPDSWVVAVTTLDPDAVVLGVHADSDVPAVRDAVAAIQAARPRLAVLLGGGRQELVGDGEPLGHSLRSAAHELTGRYRASPS